MRASPWNASISLFAMLAHAGCAPEASPPSGTGKAPIATVTVMTASPAPAASSAPAASVTAAPSASAPPLPPKIGVCEAANDRLGAWQPTLDEVILAASAMPARCVPADVRVAAVRACAARIGKPAVTVGVGTLDDESSCQESYVPAEHGGRRWIVRQSSFRKQAMFSGSGHAVELRNGKAVLYVENDGFTEDCTPKGKPKGAPRDWSTLPPNLMHFLCGMSP